MTYLFAGITGKKEEAKQLAIEFYGPIFLMYSLYDNKRKEDDLAEMLKSMLIGFLKKWIVIKILYKKIYIKKNNNKL